MLCGVSTAEWSQLLGLAFFSPADSQYPSFQEQTVGVCLGPGRLFGGGVGNEGIVIRLHVFHGGDCSELLEDLLKKLICDAAGKVSLFVRRRIGQCKPTKRVLGMVGRFKLRPGTTGAIG